MLLFATIVIMLAAAWAQYRNGLFTSVALLMMVLVSGLVAFGFWEPLADLLDIAGQQNLKAMAGTEDMVVLVVLFCVTFGLLRLAYTYLAPEMLDANGKLQHLGAAALGLVIGYFVAGFLICALETLPLDQNFLDFEPRTAGEPGWRSVFPPDRVWLSLMRQASGGSFRWKEDRTDPDGGPVVFDREGTFELRYLRYRRTTEARSAMPYFGEFDRELGREKKNH
jgi:hypothetical protein